MMKQRQQKQQQVRGLGRIARVLGVSRSTLERRLDEGLDGDNGLGGVDLINWAGMSSPCRGEAWEARLPGLRRWARKWGAE